MAPKSSNSEMKIWRDGQMVNWDDANIHVLSHVVHYGSSVFEGVRSYETPSGGAIFRAREHMRRLLDSCRIYRMPFRYSLDDMVQAMVDTVVARFYFTAPAVTFPNTSVIAFRNSPETTAIVSADTT